MLAHPLTQPFSLPVSPIVAACLVAAVVLLAAIAWPDVPRVAASAQTVESWTGSLSIWQVVTRIGGVALLALAIAAGRLGEDDELENLAPALVVGAGWPLLVLASALVGPVWRWLDPWDAIARALRAGDEEGETGHVWPAVAVAFAWVWYLGAYSDSLDPRSVGALLAAYTVVTVAGCLALGRRRWLAACEPLGILLSWTALLPTRRLAGWRPPRGAEALLGVIAGGVLFGAARRSELWGGLNTADRALLLATLGIAAASAAGAVLLLRIDQHVAAAAVPAVAGIVVSVALDRNRLLTSVQLLPELLGDPFGHGWDPLGRAGGGLDPAPLGVRGLLLAQLAVLVAGFVAGGLVLARRVDRTGRGTAAVGLSILSAAGVIALASH